MVAVIGAPPGAVVQQGPSSDRRYESKRGPGTFPCVARLTLLVCLTSKRSSVSLSASRPSSSTLWARVMPSALAVSSASSLLVVLFFFHVLLCFSVRLHASSFP